MGQQPPASASSERCANTAEADSRAARITTRELSCPCPRHRLCVLFPFPFQFLFRLSDVDRPKAEVAARFIRQRCPGVSVQAHTKAIQDFSPKWFAQFDLVIAGLDNVEARQWLNNTLVQLVQFDDKGQPDIDTVIPLIDGGTEGFQGQARVFLPRITSCFECSLASMPPQTGFAVSDSAQAKRARSCSSGSRHAAVVM